MILSSRREAILALVGLPLGVGATLNLELLSSTALAQNALTLPTDPMMLTRRLERSLIDGGALVVARTWQVQFNRTAQGIAISGQQVDVDVSAPQALTALAEVESSRSTDELWPIMLSDDGSIMAGGAGSTDDELAHAIEVAREIIQNRPLSASEEESQMAYLTDLQTAGATVLNTMPRDLFFPRGEPFRSFRTLELPNGLIGEFEVSYEAQSAGEDRWLRSAARQIITRVGTNEQRALEEWTMRS